MRPGGLFMYRFLRPIGILVAAAAFSVLVSAQLVQPPSSRTNRIASLSSISAPKMRTGTRRPLRCNRPQRRPNGILASQPGGLPHVLEQVMRNDPFLSPAETPELGAGHQKHPPADQPPERFAF